MHPSRRDAIDRTQSVELIAAFVINSYKLRMVLHVHLLPGIPVRPRPSGLVAAAQPWSLMNSNRTDHVGSIAALPVGLSNSSTYTILICAPACVRS